MHSRRDYCPESTHTGAANYLSVGQSYLCNNPRLKRPRKFGDVIQGTGGLRKLRWTDKRRGKGKRGGLRVIYFYWVRGLEFWLFTLYDKNELSDLAKKDRATLESLSKIELKMRK
jgi:hypothetical protein